MQREIIEIVKSGPSLLSVKEIANLLQCSEQTVVESIKEKKLDAFYADNMWNIISEDFIDYLKRCK